MYLKNKQGKQGFILVEALIAFSCMTIFVLSVFSGVSQQIQQIKTQREILQSYRDIYNEVIKQSYSTQKTSTVQVKVGEVYFEGEKIIYLKK